MINKLMPKINKNVLWALFRLNEKVPTEVKQLKLSNFFNQELENILNFLLHYASMCIPYAIFLLPFLHMELL